MILPEIEILNFLRESYNLRLPNDFFRTVPQQSTILTVYRCLLSTIYDLDENFFLTDENAPGEGMTKYLTLLQSLINDITPSESEIFYTSDLVKPKPARMRFFLSAMISFIRFILIRMNEAKVIFDEVDEQRVVLANEDAAIVTLENDVAKQTSTNDMSKRRKIELAAMLHAAQDEFAQLSVAKDELKELMLQKRQKSDQLQEALVVCDNSIATLRQELAVENQLLDKIDAINAQRNTLEADIKAAVERRNHVVEDVEKIRLETIRIARFVDEKKAQHNELITKLRDKFATVRTVISNTKSRVCAAEKILEEEKRQEEEDPRLQELLHVLDGISAFESRLHELNNCDL